MGLLGRPRRLVSLTQLSRNFCFASSFNAHTLNGLIPFYPYSHPVCAIYSRFSFF